MRARFDVVRDMLGSDRERARKRKVDRNKDVARIVARNDAPAQLNFRMSAAGGVGPRAQGSNRCAYAPAQELWWRLANAAESFTS